MEADRYQQNRKLFIVAMIGLLLSLSLVFFALYLVPFFLWSWGYKIPGFILDWREWLVETYTVSNATACWIIFSIFLIPGLIAGFISKWASTTIENAIYDREENIEPPPTPNTEVKESFTFGMRIMLLILAVVVALFFIDWLISSPIPTPIE